ncbi:MAG TPA: acetyl-CoA carboxylase biotin carboxyl carrier protein [Pyrinomonadaceae bacterium]|jgi:acetyl-CoA carboxylase biotin carboxyl carrier protein
MSEQATMQQPSPEEEPQEAKQERQGGGREQRGRRRRHSGQHGQQQPSTGQSSRRPDPSINMDELRDLVQLIAEHGFTDFELEREGFHVRLRRELAPQIISAPAAQPETGAQSTLQASTAAEATNASASSAHSAATQTQPRHPGAEAEAAASADEGLHIITSPIVGTFYRSPSPTSESFVRIGSHVEPDTVVCIIEAMKLMNEILAETTGEVVKIYVENGQPVEYGQPLFGIKQ